MSKIFNNDFLNAFALFLTVCAGAACFMGFCWNVFCLIIDSTNKGRNLFWATISFILFVPLFALAYYQF